MSFLFFDKEGFKNPIFEASMIKAGNGKKKKLNKTLSECFIKDLCSRSIVFEAIASNGEFGKEIDDFISNIRITNNLEYNKNMVNEFKKAVNDVPDFGKAIGSNSALRNAFFELNSIGGSDPLKGFLRSLINYAIKSSVPDKTAILKQAAVILDDAIESLGTPSIGLKRLGSVVSELIDNIDSLLVKFKEKESAKPTDDISSKMFGHQTSHVAESIVLESVYTIIDLI